MKLSEALIEKSHLNKKIAELKEHLVLNSKIQEGDSVTEAMDSIFAELGGVHNQLLQLTKNISTTNYETKFTVDGVEKTLSDALIEKDILDKKIAILKHVQDNCNIKANRYSRTEIKYVVTFDVNILRNQIENLTKQKRKLDIEIQSMNWKTDLIKN